MYMVFLVLAAIVGLVGLGCFIMVLIQMFQNDQMGLAIACIVLTVCTGLGPLIAFIYGWIQSSEWGIKNVMLAWTGCIVLQILFAIGMIASMPDMAVSP